MDRNGVVYSLAAVFQPSVKAAPPPLSLSLSKAPLYGQRAWGSFDFAG